MLDPRVGLEEQTLGSRWWSYLQLPEFKNETLYLTQTKIPNKNPGSSEGRDLQVSAWLDVDKWSERVSEYHFPREPNTP